MAGIVTDALGHRESTFQGTGGVRLWEQSWRPLEEPKAVLVLVHGLKDHSSRYGLVAAEIVKLGISVYAFDLRGHGHSEGPRAWVENFDDYVGDLLGFIASVAPREPGRPIFLFGHSMGGAIVTKYLLVRSPSLRGVILSGPALQRPSSVSGFLVGFTKFLSAVAPHAKVFKSENSDFSRDPNVVAEMDADPLIYQKPAPARTAAELLRAMEYIHARMDSVGVPLLILHGTADKLSDPEGSRELFRRAGSADKSLKLYEGFYHDLLHEPGKEQVMADLLGWLNAHRPP